MRWDGLCRPKAYRGLGFKQLHNFNIAMLSKQGWRLLSNPHTLISKILKARYYPKSSFVEASLGSNPSYAWRSIMAAQKVIIQGSWIQVGGEGGQHTTISNAPWLPDKENELVTTELTEDVATTPVSGRMIPNQRRWNYDVIMDIFNIRDSELILHIPLSSRRASDEWYWLTDPKGIYSVRSYYKLLDFINEPPDSCIWHKIWKLAVPANVKNFFWRAATNVVSIADNLIQRRVKVNYICPICNASNELLLHILMECPFAKTCWLLLLVGFVGA